MEEQENRTDNRTDNDGDNNGQGHVLRQGNSSGPTKEFLLGSEMRKMKAANGSGMMENTNRAHLKKPQPEVGQPSLKRSLAGPRVIQSAPNVAIISRAQQPMNIQDSPINESSIGPVVEMEVVTSGDTIVEETPMDLGGEPKPPDPGELFSGSELDEIMAEGIEAVMNWGNRYAPLEGNENEA
ncbi:hypothetical protein PIB30_026527 [Stylosanthes scabra]|uniref:Uncharacterized protein n=1 Tax=Stylosanthes scabra TaxID=79078 RepID=A0ABU6ZBS7_9FABA|nr:hypothetical protein [Stylosanthes scabra]